MFLWNTDSFYGLLSDYFDGQTVGPEFYKLPDCYYNIVLQKKNA